MKLQIKTVQFVFFIKENMFSEKWFLGRGGGGGGRGAVGEKEGEGNLCRLPDLLMRSVIFKIDI